GAMLALSWQVTLVALVLLPIFIVPAKYVGPGARAQLLRDELALIEAARGNGRSWDEIGTLLGVPVATAKERPATIRRAMEDLNRLDASSFAIR
ncbi:hypothetical protein ACWEJ6_52305, partial [Nonomuraea sp. NPDC004702]